MLPLRLGWSLQYSMSLIRVSISRMTTESIAATPSASAICFIVRLGSCGSLARIPRKFIQALQCSSSSSRSA